jgi:hypothetical protein
VLVELNATAKTLHLVAPNGATIDANTTINGNLSVNGTISASGTITAPNVVGTTNGTFGGKAMAGHTHGGVQTGPGTTGGPT